MDHADNEEVGLIIGEYGCVELSLLLGCLVMVVPDRSARVGLAYQEVETIADTIHVVGFDFLCFSQMLKRNIVRVRRLKKIFPVKRIDCFH